jgi:hypothetical protein
MEERVLYFYFVPDTTQDLAIRNSADVTGDNPSPSDRNSSQVNAVNPFAMFYIRGRKGEI